MEWILKKLAFGLIKAITVDQYKTIKAENKLKRDYDAFIAVLQNVAKQRLVTCRVDEITRECPSASLIEHYYQDGKTSSGTAPLRIFTIIGSDGQIINIQGFDLTETVLITVRHTDGKMDYEKIDPVEAMKRLKREAGYGQ